MHSALMGTAVTGFDLRDRSGYNQSGPRIASGGNCAH